MSKKTTDFDPDVWDNKNADPTKHETDTSILLRAADFGVDLESLELVDAAPPTAELPMQKKAEPKEHDFWQDMDISLNDIINVFISNSERPVILVSNDKIAYLNDTAKHMLEIADLKQVREAPFLQFVDKRDWNVLTANIGEMLTSGTKQKIRLRSMLKKQVNMEFQAVYLPDSSRFSFILVGNHFESRSEDQSLDGLYDELTGLPTFFLFEDRVQMAINNENYKDARLQKDMVAVAAIDIDNLEVFQQLNMEDFVMKKLAGILGLKYPFWVLIFGLRSRYDLEVELNKIIGIFKQGINDNFTTHEIFASIGCSIYPESAQSAKKIIEQTIAALKEAKGKEGNALVFYHS